MYRRNEISTLAIRASMALALTLLAVPLAMAQEQLWIKPFEEGQQYRSSSFCPDGEGGMFAAGLVMGAVTLSLDIVVSRFDHVGDLIWTRQFGTTSTERDPIVASDGEGGMFVCGWTWGSLAGPNIGNTDTFLAHYNAEGVQTWIRQFNLTNDNAPLGLAHDDAGGVYICGSVRDGLGVPTVGYWDVYLIRYDRDGNRVWARQFGSTSQDRAGNLAIDGSGGVYMVGTLPGSFAGASTGAGSLFLTHFDNQGDRTWLHRFTRSREGSGVEHLVFDEVDGVYVAGGITERIGSTWTYHRDFYVSHFTSSGVPDWTSRFGTSEPDYLTGLLSDEHGGFYMYGRTEGALVGPHLGEADLFLAHYDNSRNLTWSRQFGTSQHEWSHGLLSDGAGGMLITGRSYGGYAGGVPGVWSWFIARYGDADCYHADCDRSTGIGVLDIFDFLCFQNAFVSADPFACDCDPDPVCNIFDFLCFQNAFVSGCP